MVITTADGKVAEGLEQELFEPIAVIGLGALMPDAKDIDAFWQNITQGKVSIKDVNLNAGRARSKTFGKQVAQEMLKKASHIPKSELLLKGLNLIGADGVNRRGLLGKLTRVNYGQLKSQQQHLSSLAMMENRKTLTVQNAE